MNTNALRALSLGLALAAALAWPAAALAQQDEGDVDALQHRLWLEAGLGAGQMAFDSSRYADAGTGFSLDGLVGARITPRWSAGVVIGAVGLKPSNRNYDPNAGGSSIWGEAITHVGLVAQFEPYRDQGWFYGGGIGSSYYHNKALEDSVGRSGGRIGNGAEFMLRLGYDWPQGQRSHVQFALSVDFGHMGLDAPVNGSFDYTTLSAQVGIALR